MCTRVFEGQTWVETCSIAFIRLWRLSALAGLVATEGRLKNRFGLFGRGFLTRFSSDLDFLVGFLVTQLPVTDR